MPRLSAFPSPRAWSKIRLVLSLVLVFLAGVVHPQPARAQTDGSIDPTFLPYTASGGSVSFIIPESDAKILISGSFGGIITPPPAADGLGRALSYPTAYVARLNAGGSQDTTFDATALDQPANEAASYQLALEPGGAVLVAANPLVRLLPNGALDRAFQLDRKRAKFTVRTILVQGSGKILVAGTLDVPFRPGGINWLFRLNSDGSFDRVLAKTDGLVDAAAFTPGGKIVLAGEFTKVAGQPRHSLARLNPDGTLDTSFDPGPLGIALLPDVAQGTIRTLAVQPDRRIVCGGVFTMVDGVPRPGLARFNRDGSLDSSFDPSADIAALSSTPSQSTVNSLALQPDGKILAGGFFSTRSLIRLTTAGHLDPSFVSAAPADRIVNVIALQPDGKILLDSAPPAAATPPGTQGAGILRLLNHIDYVPLH